MNIGDAAQLSGLPAKTIRYYEDIGLVTPRRGGNGYRSFAESDLHKLAFIARARALGFSIVDCRTLLGLYEDTSRASGEVKRVARQNLEQIDAKIADLKSMRATLSQLIRECAGDDRPNCPILKDLGGEAETVN